MYAKTLRIEKEIFSDRINNMDFDINKIHANNLKRLWLSSGMTQDKIAEAIKIRNTDFNSLVNGKKVFGKAMVEKLCKVLKVRPIEFYRENIPAVSIATPSPCTSSPICQDLCAICDSLPEHIQKQLLKYAKFIRQDYMENTKATASNVNTQNGTGVIHNDSGEHPRLSGGLISDLLILQDSGAKRYHN